MTRSLAGIASLYLDANILIYLVEGNAALRQRVHSAFREIDDHNISLFTSEITVTECLNGAYCANLEALAKKYLELLSEEGFITVLPISSDVCIEAARLRATHKLKTVDAIHLASATLASCQALLSNDGAFRSTHDVLVIQLDEFG